MLSVGNFTENILKSGRKCIILDLEMSPSLFLFVICIIKMTGGCTHSTFWIVSFWCVFPLPFLKVKHKKLNFDPLGES